MIELRIQTSLLHGFSWIFMDFEGFAALTQHDLSCIQLSKMGSRDPIQEPSATLLDEELGKRTNRWDHPCSVCDGKAMTRGTLDHLRSKGHWMLGDAETWRVHANSWKFH